MKQALDILISSSVLILALCALRFFLRGKISPRVQYGLWLLVALRLLIPVSFGESRASVMNFVPAASQEEAVASTTAVSPAVALPEEGRFPQEATGTAQDIVWQTTQFEASAPKESISPAQVLVSVWLLGTLGFGVWILLQNLRLAARLKNGRVLLEVPEAKIPVYLTERLPSACLFGLLHPAVYLTPSSMDDGGTPNRYVLAHELTHYRRGDHIWGAVRLALLALYWFDPLVWLAASLSRQDCELACDEAVLRTLGDAARAAYGRTLLAQITARNSPRTLVSCATTMAAGKRSLRLRIRLIAKKPRMTAWVALLVAALTLALAACTFTGRESAGAEMTEFSQEETAGEAPEESTLPAQSAQETTDVDDSAALQEGEESATAQNAIDEDTRNEICQAVYEKLDAAALNMTEEQSKAFSGEDARENGMRGNYPNYYGAFADYFVLSNCAPQAAQRWELGLMDEGTLTLRMQDGGGNPEQTLYYSLQTGALCGWAQKPWLEADTPIGIGVDTDYADETYVVFHGYFGLFVYDLQQEKFTCALDLGAATGSTLIQGGLGNRVSVRNDEDGLKIMLTYYNSMQNGLSPLSYFIDAASGEITFAQTQDPDTFCAGGTVEAAVQLADNTVKTLWYEADGERRQLFEAWRFGEAESGQMVALTEA